MYTILIAENIPVLNKGELALLCGMIESFSLLGSVKVKILSSSLEDDLIRYGDKLEIIDVSTSFHLKKDFNYSYIEKMMCLIVIILDKMIFSI